MNRPSLRAAFGDKRAIYLQALADYWELQFAAMRKALDGDHVLETALMRVYDAALAIYFSGDGPARGCFVVGTAITEAVDDPEVRRSVMDGFRTLDTRFEVRLRRACDAGELDSDADPTALALLKQAQEMQQQMADAQAAAKDEVAEASAGGGMVTAKANGAGELVELRIDPRAIDPDDPEMLGDMVLAAANEALRAAAQAVEAKLRSQLPDLGALGLGG
jgi:DNA-binding YbaB/EbfC family protein